jgi:hypothetical protein
MPGSGVRDWWWCVGGGGTIWCQTGTVHWLYMGPGLESGWRIGARRHHHQSGRAPDGAAADDDDGSAAIAADAAEATEKCPSRYRTEKCPSRYRTAGEARAEATAAVAATAHNLDAALQSALQSGGGCRRHRRGARGVFRQPVLDTSGATFQRLSIYVCLGCVTGHAFRAAISGAQAYWPGAGNS